MRFNAFKRTDHGSSGILYTLLDQNESNSLLSQSDNVDDEYLTSIHTRSNSISGSQFKSYNVSVIFCIKK